LAQVFVPASFDSSKCSHLSLPASAMSSLKQRKPKAAEKEAPAGPQDETSLKKERYTNLILGAAEKAPPKVKPYVEQAAPYIALAIVYFQIAMPYIVKGLSTVSEYYFKLPENARYAVIGFVMCFFGGVFPATIAAYEAWKMCGGEEAIEDAKKLYHEFDKARIASAKDDLKDDDGDGVPDVDEISAEQLLQRKAGVVMAAVNPEKFSAAMTNLWTGWIGVLAVLKVQFAKAVTLGAAIGQVLYKTTSVFVLPIVNPMVDEDKQKWVPVVLRWICKAIAISIAWWVQRVISAFHSAIRGGLMFSRGILYLLNEKGIIKFDDETSYLDEIVGYSLAAVGFLFQFWSGFSLFFPLNIVLLPVRIVEGYIVWSVNS